MNEENGLPDSKNSKMVTSQAIPIEKNKTVVESTEKTHQPIKDVHLNMNETNNAHALFVTPRRVYYDTRLEAGKPRNKVIVIAEIHYDATSTIQACELDGHLAQSIHIFEETTLWLRKRRPTFRQHAVVIECMGLPQKAIFNGSVAKIIYKRKEDDYYSRVQSEKPLFIQAVGRDLYTPTRGKGSVVVCTTLYHHPQKFDQWLMYHKTLGADMIHINAHTSFSDNATELYPFYNESLNNGFVQLDIWKSFGNEAVYYHHNQVMKYQDCLYRHIGVFDYGLFYDYDDFFNPILPDQKDIHYYFSKFFADKRRGTVCIPWHQMKCGPIETLVQDLPDGNLTSILGNVQATVRSEKKCAHRLTAALLIHVHHAQSLIKGFVRRTSAPELAYVAHNRITKECK